MSHDAWLFSAFSVILFLFFCVFFNDTATTEIYTLSLHDALPICWFFIGFCLAEAATAGWEKLAAGRGGMVWGIAGLLPNAHMRYVGAPRECAGRLPEEWLASGRTLPASPAGKAARAPWSRKRGRS